jgi:hypothetical protein
MAARCFRAPVAKASLEVEVSDYEESSGSGHEAMAPNAAKGTDAARYQRRVGCVPNVALCDALGDRGSFSPARIPKFSSHPLFPSFETRFWKGSI